MISAAKIDWKKLIQLVCDAVQQDYENKKKKAMKITELSRNAESKLKAIDEISEQRNEVAKNLKEIERALLHLASNGNGSVTVITNPFTEDSVNLSKAIMKKLLHGIQDELIKKMDEKTKDLENILC